jgi:hypothetical protein
MARPVPPATQGESGGKGERATGANSTRAPAMNVAVPAAVRAPWVGLLMSRMNRTMATAMSSSPSQLTGSTPMP